MPRSSSCCGDGHGADLADDDACGEVRQFDGGLDLQAAGQTCGQGRDDGVAGARDVEDLAGAGGRVVDAGCRAQQDADSLLAHRDGQELKSCSAT